MLVRQPPSSSIYPIAVLSGNLFILPTTNALLVSQFHDGQVGNLQYGTRDRRTCILAHNQKAELSIEWVQFPGLDVIRVGRRVGLAATQHHAKQYGEQDKFTEFHQQPPVDSRAAATTSGPSMRG